MKYREYPTQTYGTAGDRCGDESGHDHRTDGPPSLDMNLRSHIGRTLRRVYEPEMASDMPRDIADLLQQLDSIPARSNGKNVSRD
jgi:hypothetical protein